VKHLTSLSATSCIGPGTLCTQGLTRMLTCSVIFQLFQHSVSEFPEVLKDFILDTGAPHTLVSDNHNAETSEKVKKMQRECGIKRQTSEPKKQIQNFCERHIQDFKRDTIELLD